MKETLGYYATIIMKYGTSFAGTLISALDESKNKGTILGDILVSSIYASEPDLIACLSKGGADLNAKFEDGRDALTLALWLDEGDVDKVFNELLRLGVSPNCVDDFGRTALHYLSRRPDCKAVELLLKHKLDVNAADRIERKLDINLEDRAGRTPLDFARIHENHAVAAFLQAHGARFGSSANPISTHNNQHSKTTKSSDEWEIDSDQGSVPWDSDSAD